MIIQPLAANDCGIPTIPDVYLLESLCRKFKKMMDG